MQSKEYYGQKYGKKFFKQTETLVTLMLQGFLYVRSTGLEPVPVAGHAPQTCAYADSATTAEQKRL